jgi:VWFA-related protein
MIREKVRPMSKPVPAKVASVLLLALLALAAAGSAAATDPVVIILQPTRAQPIVGSVDVVFAIQGASSDEVIRAEIVLDGETVAALDSPPWRAEINAGDKLDKRFLEVRVLLRGGEMAEASLESLPVRFDEVEVRLVNLAVTVKDDSGDAMKGLERDAFRVFDQGRPVAIERWDPAPAGLAVALVLDTSLTMQGAKLRAGIDAAEDFVRDLEERDLVAILAFDESLDVVAPLSSDRSAAILALESLRSGGGTALYDAVFEASEALHRVEPGFRRVAVVLSDGRDESASGLEPGSFHTLDEAVRKAHEEDVVVYTIGLGSELDSQYDFSRRMTTSEVLQRIAASTGGDYHRPRRFSGLGRSYRDILDELRHQYSIAYTPAPPRPGETWRTIRVEVDASGAEVRTREGYYIR